MKTNSNFFLECCIIFVWTIAAFFILSSPLSEIGYYKFAFKNINIPLFYWLWVFTGILFFKLLHKERKDGVKTFVLTSILFHLSVLTAQLLANSAIYSHMARPYLLYIYTAIYIFTLLSALWAFYPLLSLSTDLCLPRMPLILSPFLCFFYSIYKTSLKGALIFALCILSIIMAVFLKRLLQKLTLLIFSICTYIRRNKKILIAAIFLIALLARIAFSFMLIAKTGEDYVIASDDGIAYDKIAISIANQPGNMLKILSTKIWPPVYMVFLSLLYMLFGRNFYIVAVFQSLLGAFIAVLIYLIGKRAFNENVGIISGFLIALNQPLIFLSSGLGTEAIYLPLVTLAIFLFLDALFYGQKRIFTKIAFSGIAFALGAMTFGTLIFFFPIAFLFLILCPRQKQLFVKRLKMAAIFFASFLIIYLPVKTAYMLETGAWESKYEINGINQWFIPSRFDYVIDPDNREFIELGMTPYEPSNSLNIALTKWKDIVSISVRIFPIRIRNFFFWPKFGSFDTLFLVNADRLPNTFSPNLEFYSIVFFFIGLFFSFLKKEKTKTGAIIFIMLFILYYTFIQAIIFIPHRMRYASPVKSFLIIFFAYGLYKGFEYFRNKYNVVDLN